MFGGISKVLYLGVITSLLTAALFSPPVYFWSPILQVILLSWALFLFLYDGGKQGFLEIKRPTLPVPLALFLAFAIFYTFKSVDYALSRDFAIQLLGYAAVFFLVIQIAALKKTQGITLAIVIAGLLTSLYGLYQHCWGFEKLIGKITRGDVPQNFPLLADIRGRLEGGRVFSTFLLPSHFAAFLGMTIPLSVALGFRISKKWVQGLVGLAAGLQIVALYLTKSFSGWLSLVLASGCFAGVYLVYVKQVKRRYLAYGTGVLLLLMVLIFTGLSLTRSDNPFAAVRSNPLVLRLLNWDIATDMIADDPLVGKGLNTFGLIYPSYRRPGVNIVHHAHNTYLQLGVEMSVVGMLAFLWFCGWWVWRSVGMLRDEKNRDRVVWLSSVIVAGFAFLIHNALDFEFYLPSATMAGFAVLALAVSRATEDGVCRIQLVGARKTFVTVSGFAAVIAGSILLLLQLYGEMYYQRARYLLDLGFGSPKAAALALRKAIDLDPRNSQYHHRYGTLLFRRFARQEEGIAAVQQAVKLSPWRHYYHYDLGMMYLCSGAKEKGLEEIRRASQLSPLNEEYRRMLERIRNEMGDGDVALYGVQ